MIPVATYPRRSDAELAHATLDAAGIKSCDRATVRVPKTLGDELGGHPCLSHQARGLLARVAAFWVADVYQSWSRGVGVPATTRHAARARGSIRRGRGSTSP